MRPLALPLLALMLSLPAAAQDAAPGMPALARAGRFALGLGNHSMTGGLSGKLYLSDRVAVQAVVGSWAFFGFGAGVDGVWDMNTLVDHELFTLHWYLGAGGEFATYPTVLNSTTIAADGVGGLSFQAKKFPLEITGEFRPTFLVGSYVGWTGLWFTGGGAVRYYF